MDTRFSDIINLIKQSRETAIRTVNTELINLYWNVGAYIKQKLSVAEWGDKTVDELASFIQKHNPELKGFERRGLYRMLQFYEIYYQTKIVSAARTQLQDADNQSTENYVPSEDRIRFSPTGHKKFLLSSNRQDESLDDILALQTGIKERVYLRNSIKENYSVRTKAKA